MIIQVRIRLLEYVRRVFVSLRQFYITIIWYQNCDPKCMGEKKTVYNE